MLPTKNESTTQRALLDPIGVLRTEDLDVPRRSEPNMLQPVDALRHNKFIWFEQKIYNMHV